MTTTVEYGPDNTWQIGGSRFAFLPPEALIGPPNYSFTQPQPGTTTTSIAPYGAMMGQVQSANVGAMQASPYSPKNSPLPWMVLGLLGGVLFIHKAWGPR